MKTVIVLLLLVSIGYCGTPSTQPAGNIVELRARRAELEKSIATATAELRQVTAAITKLGRPEAFPLDRREEAKLKLSAVQYEAAMKLKFGGVGSIADPGRNWLWVNMPKGDLPRGLVAQWRLLRKSDDGTWRVSRELSSIGGVTTAGPTHGGPVVGTGVVNAYVVIAMDGTPVYELLWKADKPPVAPNGVSWWKDDSLLAR